MEDTGINKTVNKTNNCQEATLSIRRYESIIKTQNKKAMGYLKKQGQLLKYFL